MKLGICLVSVGSVLACRTTEPSDRAEANRQQFIADELACRDALNDRWSHPQLTPKCQHVADVYDQQKQQEVAAAAQKTAQSEAQRDAELDKAAGASCDEKARAKREKWLVTEVRDEDEQPRTPRDEGMRAGGSCSQKLVTQSLDCSDQMIHTVWGDTPWTVEAQAKGFTRFVCREVDHLTSDDGVAFRREVERPIEWVITSKPKKKSR